MANKHPDIIKNHLLTLPSLSCRIDVLFNDPLMIFNDRVANNYYYKPQNKYFLIGWPVAVILRLGVANRGISTPLFLMLGWPTAVAFYNSYNFLLFFIILII